MQESLKKNDISQVQSEASQESRAVDRSAANGSTQSREFYRVHVSTPVEWQQLDPIGQELDTHRGRLTDLSGGGLAFRTNHEVAPGDRIHILLTELPLIEKLDTHATVLRVTPLPVPEEASPTWQMACVLDELTARVRDRLVSSIFEQQRLSIQREQKDVERLQLQTRAH